MTHASDPNEPDSADTTPEVRTGTGAARARSRAPIVTGVVIALVAAGALSFAALRAGPDTSAPTTGTTGAATPTASPSGPAPTSAPSTGQSDEAAAAIAAVQRREKDDPFALGRPDAKVVLVEFSDWRCPFCGLWARSTKPELQRFIDDGTLRIEYRDLPIFGEESHLAAKAGRAAGEQGRFWQFYDAVFAAAPERGHPTLDAAKLREFAQKAGVPDLEKFDADMSGTAVEEQIRRDVADAQRLGAPNSVPLFLIGEEALSGAQPTEVFVEAVERQAARAS
ncbi:DsbA family protein [Mobilicoccus caccae]|uniref:Thioredoxin domain-containing protein n=1 Tax=Mobilicoccus caccae TaxID=1859295 RepID=A0ABQ6IVA0_9MICO|nr:thioredoxin domain-containing protein [Mobilicoccus caccae]GMA41295.1 hypothetical protein GCM10025883_33400 [Mobilicoccus caccae]